ncbi:MAG: substrate-binding domain-containing protein [Treponema sp.]|nr:substrate-binding domain-containing protein [Treponema sp.]
MKKPACRICALLLLALVSFIFLFAPRSHDTATATRSLPLRGSIRLSTTTSTQNSGLLDFIVPVFTAQTGWGVDVIAVGTGAALRMGRDGDADALLVHARADELQFMADGHGSVRYDVMYNDFLVVGPPGGVIARNGNVLQTLRDIAARNLPFVSRGDDSGTHRMELVLWRAAGANARDMSKYYSVGQGMGATLQMAHQMLAYTLTDRATWLFLTRNGAINLPAVSEHSEELKNYYGVILVNPARHPHINAEGGRAFVEWMASPAAQELIAEYGLAEFGAPLFTPNAGETTR